MSQASSTKTPRTTIAEAMAVPFRFRDDKLQFCVITSRKQKNWIFPKGVVEPGDSLEETALKEAFEEAGLKGKITGQPLGSYQTKKWGTSLNITALLMKVGKSADQWHEDDVRQRRWVDPKTAHRLLSRSELKEFTDLAVRQITRK